MRGPFFWKAVFINSLCLFFFGRMANAADAAKTGPHDLRQESKVFGDHARDFSAMHDAVAGDEKHGVESEILQDLDDISAMTSDRLSSANIELSLYDGSSCETDRIKARALVKDHIDYFVDMFDQQIKFIGGVSTFIKVPAEAQAALQMKNDLRNAKQKLEAIASSL